MAAAVFAGAIALGGAFTASRVLRRREAHVSHQAPIPEAWFLAPPAPPESIAQGRLLFLASCAHCHGADAAGDEGPDLHNVGMSDRYIAATITRGIKGEMPSFRKKLGPPEILRLTAYLRSLGPDSG